MAKPPLVVRHRTVLITGASSGLGAEFARRFAAAGADLVLVARRTDRLQALATELSNGHGITVTVLPMDLARPGAGQELHDRLAERGITVTGLVNNAGFANQGAFHELDPERLSAEVSLDVLAVVEIARAFIDDLRAASSGFLVNLSSIAGHQPMPTLAVYGASKAFVLSFTHALREEARGTALRVLALSPGPVDTEFFEVAGEAAAGGLPRMSAQDVVAATLAALARRHPPAEVVPGVPGRALTTAGSLIPRSLMTRSIGTAMRRGELG